MDKPSFEESLDEIILNIEKRRSSWRLSTMSFDDVRQILLIRAFQKYHLFDPTKSSSERPLEHWINTLISHGIINLLRDGLTKFARPCLRCAHNMGADDCDWTKSKKQCNECWAYKWWKDKKESHYNIEAAVPLDNHIQEVHNLPNDFLDIERAKRVIDDKIRPHLTTQELKMYTLLFIENRDAVEVGKMMRFKRNAGSKIPGYQYILKLRKKVVLLAKNIIAEEDLA